MSHFTGISPNRVLPIVLAVGMGSVAVACSGDQPGSPQQIPQQSAPPTTPAFTSAVDESDAMQPTTRIRFTSGDAEATATLRDNETARDFASLLPMTIDMHDLFGREKPGRLPRALNEAGQHQFTYEVGDVAYWPPAQDVALFYADDGQRTIPTPGIIVLATIDSGLNEIASAGDDFQMTVEPLD